MAAHGRGPAGRDVGQRLGLGREEGEVLFHAIRLSKSPNHVGELEGMAVHDPGLLSQETAEQAVDPMARVAPQRLGEVGVHLGGTDAGVPQQRLHDAQIGPVSQQAGGVPVALMPSSA